MPTQPLARYVAAVVAGGVICLIAMIASGGLDLLDARHPELLLLLMGCAVVAELTPLKVVLRAAEGEITASNTFAFALLICYGAAPAAIAFALGTILADGIRRKPPERIAFNAAQYIITVAISGLVLSALGERPSPPRRPDRPRARRPPRYRRRRPRLPRAQLGLRRRRDRARREDRLPALPRLRPLPAGVDRRPAARPLARARDRRRLLARRAAAAVPAATGDPPRWPPGDRQGAPGAPRRAHRAAEPRAVPRPRPAGRARRRAAATAAWR